jgi:hypothetical protein
MKRALVTVVVLLLVGCGGGSSGGGDNPGTSPTITGMEVCLIGDDIPRTSFVTGDIVDGYIEVSDPDHDLAYLHALEYYPATATEPYSDQIDWELSAQTHESMIYLPLDAFEVTGPEGTWRLDFWAEDIEGNLSDTYTFTYTVTQ